MDSYSPSSLVYRPGAESDWEGDTGSPVYQPPTPAAAKPRFDLLPPLRDPYLVPDPYHSNPWVRRTMAPTSAMGIPSDDVHQYVRTSEFERQRIEHEIRHDLQGQRMDSLANQLGYQKELISSIEKEMLENRTETARAEARPATRVTIAVLVLVITFLLVESYERR
ncbi:hypothetical protein L1987_37982 [Smallanthus sonchifolius]|uniref:Uncharacterized protein n=1 Tax=Smallanthus sonchifolius TaxID=185202 RepID=A0ACB9HHY0_9ASTR|nr:hypothetical protein L1987_37982 [Smallanthus sonchifolius]